MRKNERPAVPCGKLNPLVSFLVTKIAFISWTKHWKGVYVHCISKTYYHRFYLWGHDKHKKTPKDLMETETVTSWG